MAAVAPDHQYSHHSQHPPSNMQIQPQPTMVAMAPPGMIMPTGPCPMCGSPAPPIVAYEINTCGWVVIVVCILFCYLLVPLIGVCVVCSSKTQPDQCHDPRARCGACGAIRMG